LPRVDLQWALAHRHGDRKAPAERLGVSESTFYKKLAG
jgi:DNA-binding NtrC family response regulator